jgi:HNH endonuclease
MGEPAACWLWLTGRSRRYGQFTVDGRHVGAHRFAWELHHGRPVPNGMVIHHRCRVTRCVNPRHLMLGTQDENIMRDTSPPAVNARKLECLRGHPLSGANLRLRERPTGEVERVCITCQGVRNWPQWLKRRLG